MIAVGIVANPKLKKPVLVTSEGSGIVISRLDDAEWTDIGDGYYEEDSSVTHQTGFVRVHTPTGVEPKAQGYGTSLYTALCLGATMPEFLRRKLAAQRERGRVEIKPRSVYEGVASQPGERSGEAEAWWRRAADFDLATRSDFTETEEDVDVSSEAQDCVERHYKDASVSVSATASIERTMEADVYPYSKAEDAGLIIASFAFEVETGVRAGGTSAPDPGALWKLVREKPDHVRDVYKTALFALDVRGLDLDAINLLGMLATISDATEEELDHLRLRWDLGLDPSVPITQMRLPLKPNQAAAAEDALEHAARARSLVHWDRLASLP